MPTYSYNCVDCGVFDDLRSMSERHTSLCPECGGESPMIPTAPATIFRGWGFTPRFHRPYGHTIKDPNDTFEENEAGKLVEKKGAGHNKPEGPEAA